MPLRNCGIIAYSTKNQTEENLSKLLILKFFTSCPLSSDSKTGDILIAAMSYMKGRAKWLSRMADR